MSRKEIDERRLLEAALNEFSENSFEEASVNRIIASAGISKGSFYYRFKSKYELYLYLLKEGNRAKWAFINSSVRDNEESDTDIFRLFNAQAKSGLEFAAAHPKYYRLSKMLLKEKGSPIYKQAIEDLGGFETSRLHQLIVTSYDAGLFKEAFSLDFIEKMLNSLFLSFDDLLFGGDDMNLDEELEYLDQFLNLLQHGLRR